MECNKHNEKLLCFYDSGCYNACLSERAYAALDTVTVSPGPTTLEVAGGTRVTLPYGNEKFWLELNTQKDKKSVAKLTTVLSKRYENRKGGYCRVVKSGFRFGDNAPTAFIELVDKDFNAKGQDSGPVQKKSDNNEDAQIKENQEETKDIKKTKK